MDTKSNDDSAGSDSLDKLCVMVETATLPAATGTQDDKCTKIIESNVTSANPLRIDQKTEIATGASENSTENIVGDGSTTFAAFETKLTQISQNLKETMLTETATTTQPEPSAPTIATINDDSEISNAAIVDGDADAADRRVKKVRFHPDVKQTDGGQRCKKKRRSDNPNGDADTGAIDIDGIDCGLDSDDYCDEDDDDEADEQFDLERTIAEAQLYLKQHPLTFARRVEENGEQLRDGPLENASQVEDQETYDNDEDFYKSIKPENGIERILGKETKGGKVEFLLRYESEGGLFWESEDYIKRMCPTLLKAYEKNRERRQQQLMHHVAQRQSLRQRYTDF